MHSTPNKTIKSKPTLKAHPKTNQTIKNTQIRAKLKPSRTITNPNKSNVNQYTKQRLTASKSTQTTTKINKHPKQIKQRK